MTLGNYFQAWLDTPMWQVSLCGLILCVIVAWANDHV
jgi:hypothetical protein